MLAGLLSAGITPGVAAPFLPTYTGPVNEALDLNSIGVAFDGANFILSSTSNALISTAPSGALFVWGVNRGAGTARFNTSPPTATNPDIGSNVLFDSVFVINPFGTSVVNLFNGPATAVPAGDITVSGNTITAVLPDSFLPSDGFAPSAYTFDLWPRVGAGQNDQIAQFFGTSNATNPVNVGATSVPEPRSWAIMAAALGMLALFAFRPRSAPARAG